MRYLFAPIPVTGHVNPGLPIARELVRRGHDVRWYSTPRFKRTIEGIGARWIPLRNAIPIDEENFDMWPDRPAEGLAQLRFDIKHLFIEFMRGALIDLEQELQRECADVLVADNSSAVIEAVHQKTGLPWAVYGMSVIPTSSRDTAPFGLGIMPSASPLGRLRNQFLYWLVDQVIFREANRYNAQFRREAGIPPLGGSIFDFAKNAHLYLQSGVPSFDYPRTDMPSNVHFIGAPIPEAPAGWTKPFWWEQLQNRRVVLVTQGTINNQFEQLIHPAIRALANEDVLVVVTTGSRNPEDAVTEPLPPNVRVERFVPYAELMPHVDVLLTNGGYGSIQIALAHGVPVVAIGNTEEKPEIANRVNWSGVGIGLKVRIPAEAQIRDAVKTVMNIPTYAARAEAFRYELSGLNPATIGADLLEELASSCHVDEEEALEKSA